MTDFTTPFAKLNEHRAAEARLTRQIALARKVAVNGIFAIGLISLTTSIGLSLMNAVGDRAEIARSLP